MQEQSVQVDKVMPQERLLEQVAKEIREVIKDMSKGADCRQASPSGHEGDIGGGHGHFCGREERDPKTLKCDKN